jgi:hypothetical protein
MRFSGGGPTGRATSSRLRKPSDGDGRVSVLAGVARRLGGAADVLLSGIWAITDQIGRTGRRLSVLAALGGVRRGR